MRRWGLHPTEYPLYHLNLGIANFQAQHLDRAIPAFRRALALQPDLDVGRLLLAQALNMLPPEVVIIGVQPGQLNWDTGLSPEVEASLPGLLAAVLVEARNVKMSKE